VPRFLDFDLDDQQRSLFQAWMCSNPPDSLPEAREAALTHSGPLRGRAAGVFDASMTLVCSAASETPFAFDSTANLIFGGEPTHYFVGISHATATVAGAYASAADDRPVPLYSEGEPESAFIENDRVIAFRPIVPELRRAFQSANLRLTPDALRFVARARGRRLRFEEDPETQSE